MWIGDSQISHSSLDGFQNTLRRLLGLGILNFQCATSFQRCNVDFLQLLSPYFHCEFSDDIYTLDTSGKTLLLGNAMYYFPRSNHDYLFYVPNIIRKLNRMRFVIKITIFQSILQRMFPWSYNGISHSSVNCLFSSLSPSSH